MKKIILFIWLTILITNVKAEYQCENSGRITYQNEECSTGICENKEEQTNLIELFDKIKIGQLKIEKGKISKDGLNTEVFFELDGINDSKNNVKLTLKYDGIDKDGFIIDNQTIYGTLPSYTKLKIKSSSILAYRKTKTVENTVKWRFNSWSATVN